MKRTTLMLGIVAAMGVSPSLANAANGTQALETQIARTQLVRSALVRPQLVETAVLRTQLHRSALVRSAALTDRRASVARHGKTRLSR